MIMWKSLVLGIVVICLTLAVSNSNGDEGSGFFSGSGSGSGDEISTTEPDDDETDACAPDPCQNNATCMNLVDDFKCNCTEGYIGKTCNNTDACINNPCRNGAACVNSLDNFNCSCTTGFTGNTCETPIGDTGQQQGQGAANNDSKTKVILPLVSVAIGCCAVAIVVTMGALFYFVKVL